MHYKALHVSSVIRFVTAVSLLDLVKELGEGGGGGVLVIAATVRGQVNKVHKKSV